jgi:hypothetical protein
MHPKFLVTSVPSSDWAITMGLTFAISSSP